MSDRLPEILKKVRRIEFITRGLVQETVGGEYHSSFKGQGIDFDEFREYQPGDEFRSIDWNVTARTGTPFIKKFVEDRELTVILAVDVSASGDFGSGDISKRDLAAEVAAVFAFSAVHNQDKVGLLLFSDHIELYLPPKKGAGHILRVVREILAWEPSGKATEPTAALELLVNAIDRRSLVFLLSDFQIPDLSTHLRIASVKHDLVAVQVTDPLEVALPEDGGRVTLEDPETGEQVSINAGDAHLRERYRARAAEQQDDLEGALRRLSIDHMHLFTDRDYLPALHSFFKRRARRAA